MSNDPLSPNTSPSSPSTPLFGGKRANRIPIYLTFAVIGLFACVMAAVAVGRMENGQQYAEEMAHSSGDSANIVESIVGEYAPGLVQPKMPELQVARLDTPPLPGDDDDLPYLPPPSSGGELAAPPVDPQVADAERQRMEEVKQALTIKTSVQGADARQGGGGTSVSNFGSSPSSRPNTTDQFNNRLQLVKDTFFPDGVDSGGGGIQLADGGKAQQGGYGQFDTNNKEDRWRNPARLENPRTPFEIRTTTVIPAVMLSGINSDLPGPIIAQVSQNVYDTATGEHLLIPQGSKLFGAYDSNVSFGQSRVLFAWQRIVFPDGKVYDLGAMPGTDAAGYAGAADKVNNHYIRTFFSAILMSLVTAGVEMSQDRTQGMYDRKSAGSAMSEALGQQLGQVTAQMVSKNLNVSPTIEIRPGFLINVVVTKDLTLPQAYNRPTSRQQSADMEETQ